MKNIKEIIALICCCNLVFPVPIAMAAPQGGKVVGGSAHIHQSGGTTTINQSSNRAVINWNSFDIGKNETVRHNMPSANSAGLHRVVGGGGASQIMGQLQSNGNVYLVNPAGVVIHKGARIDANSFTATSRDISNDNFMKGNMVFDKPGRPDAEVINQGTISVKENGLAALVAPTVRNDGVIAGKLAKVALASGDSTWKLDMHGDDLITFTVDEKDVDTLHAVDGTPLAGVENSGSIKAEGGVVVLTAAQLDGIVGSVVNSGEVSAASAELKGGKIVFKGAGSGVDIVNTGTVDASSAVADGGSVRMDTDGNVRSSGLIAATGGQKGGKVVVTARMWP
jgi:filamentous hemagglutinin family protein